MIILINLLNSFQRTNKVQNYTIIYKEKTLLKCTELIWLESQYTIQTNSFSGAKDTMQLQSATLKCRIISPTPTLHSLYLIIIVSVCSSYAQFLCTRNSSHFNPSLLSTRKKVPFKFKEPLGRFGRRLGAVVGFFLSLLYSILFKQAQS